MAEQGICHICAENKECLVSNQGWICRDCFHKAAFNPAFKDKKIIVPPPDPDAKTYVFMEGPGYGNFITIEGTLYGFETREVAEYAIKKFGETMNLAGIDIREVNAMEPFLYTLKTPGIRMLAVKDFKERTAEKK